MDEHLKLKTICDEIGYDSELWRENYIPEGFYNIYPGISIICNVREIIFTPEFWNKFIKYCAKVNLNKKIKYNDLLEELFENNLHDPVTYLYNLLFNK